MLIAFAPPPGMISDDTTFSAPGRWAYGSMIRFYNGTWQIIGGWESLTTTLLTGVCRTAFPWSDAAGILNVAFGTHSALQLWQGGTLYTITPASFVAGAIDGSGGPGYGAGVYGGGTYGSPATGDFFPLTWSLGAFGSKLIANPRNQTIYIWANVPATPAIALTNAPAKVTFTVCVPQRQVMALGCNEEVSGTFNQLCIRWSDIEAPTVWTTLPSNNAGEYILEGGGRIVAGRVVGDYVFVWTDVALYLGQYIGDPGETWRFTKAGDHCGLIGPNAVVIQGQTAYWISPDAQFWSATVGSAPQIVPCPIRTDFAYNIALGQSDKIVAATIGTYSEIRFFYPDGRDGFENSRDLCLSPGGWASGMMPRTSFIDAGPSVSPIGTTYGGNAYWHERGTSADGGLLTGYIESTDFYLDDAAAGVMIKGVRPNFKGQVGAFSLSLYMREYPQAMERTKGPYVLAAGASKKDFRASGRVARVRLDFSSSPAAGRMGKLEFDVETIGGR